MPQLTRDALLLLLREVGAVDYSTPPMRAVTGVSLTFDAIERFAALLSAQPAPDQVWNEAIEAAAKVCEDLGYYMSDHSAEAIRALARPSQAQELSKPPFQSSCDDIGSCGCQEPCDKPQPVSGAVDEQHQKVVVRPIGTYGPVDAIPMAVVIYDDKKIAECYTNEDAEFVGAALSRAQQAPAVSEYHLNVLESCANWLLGRSETVWAKEFHHGWLMKEYAKDLHEMRALLSQPAAAPVSEQTKEPTHKSLNAQAADLLRPFLKEGEKVIWREPFRWHDDNGVLSNHYDGMSLEALAETFGYQISWDANLHHAAIVYLLQEQSQ